MRLLTRKALPLAIALAAVAGPSAADTFTVNSTLDASDTAPGDGICASAALTCTLRAAIEESNALVGADTITLPGGSYMRTINAEFVVDPGSLTINGAGATSSVIDANTLGRGFNVRADALLNLNNLTVEDGVATDGGGAIRMRDNSEVNLFRVILQGNSSTAMGGGAILHGGSTLTIAESTIRFNTADDSGGGIRAPGGTTEITDSTFNDNTATNGNGGAIQTGGLVMATNSTFSDNSAGNNGGAIHANNVVDLTHTTIAFNTAGNLGGALFNNATLNLLNSIVHENGPANCEGPVASGGGNVSSDGSCGLSEPSDQENVDADLGPLQDNGGPTQTHALLDGSPAIDAALNAGCTPEDQRGESRPEDGDGDTIALCDAGAYEAPAVAPVPALPGIALALLGLLLGVGGARRVRG